MRRLTLVGLVAMVALLAGCSHSLVIESPPQSALQVAAKVAQGQATLEDLRAAAVNNGNPDPQSSAALCAIDQNNDLLIDDAEILAAVKAWIEGTPIDGQYIDDATILAAISAWVEQTKLTCGPPPSNKPPIAKFTFSPSTPEVGDTVSFDGSGSYDPDGMVSKYAWGFGDSTTATGKDVTHVYSSSGNYTVTLMVTDDKGATNSTQQAISIKERPQPNQTPVAKFTCYSIVSQVGSLITFDASDSYDPDGYITSFEWDFGDGEGNWGQQVQHAFCWAGTYTVYLTVTDDKGATSGAYLRITIDPLPENYPQPGDILYHPAAYYGELSEGGQDGGPPVQEEGIGAIFGHVGIVDCNFQVIEAEESIGITETSIKDFINRYTQQGDIVILLRVKVSDRVKARALKFAEDQYYKPYDSLSVALAIKQIFGDSYYCSELVWAAYEVASGAYLDSQGNTWCGTVNLDAGDEGGCYLDLPVTPNEIDKSDWTWEVGYWGSPLP